MKLLFQYSLEKAFVFFESRDFLRFWRMLKNKEMVLRFQNPFCILYNCKSILHNAKEQKGQAELFAAYFFLLCYFEWSDLRESFYRRPQQQSERKVGMTWLVKTSCKILCVFKGAKTRLANLKYEFELMTHYFSLSKTFYYLLVMFEKWLLI